MVSHRKLLTLKLLATFGLYCNLVVSCWAENAPGSEAPENGHWITESGNLEVEIAPCGESFCGTIVRVIANNAMAGGPGTPAAPPPAQGASPVGKKILYDLKRTDGKSLQGHIYNRGNDKVYNSLVALVAPDQLKLTIYEDSPAAGKTQIWKRAGAAQ